MFKYLFKKKNSSSGITLIELLISIAILAGLSFIVLSLFSSFKNKDALGKDSELVIEVLRQAKSMTLNSKNSSQYGVRFLSNSLILFSGNTFSSSSPINQTNKISNDISVSTSLNGSGIDVVFDRLTGQTDDFGQINLTSSSSGEVKNIIIYKTGIIE